MEREKLTARILQSAVNGRLSCEKAHSLSQELNTPLSDIGKICNELQIKITACQLGCF